MIIASLILKKRKIKAIYKSPHRVAILKSEGLKACIIWIKCN